MRLTQMTGNTCWNILPVLFVVRSVLSALFAGFLHARELS